MITDDQIRDETLQYDINREAAKIWALSSRKIEKYEYLTGEEIVPSNQKQILEQAKFTYSPLGKAFVKQIKTVEGQGKKQTEALKDLKPKGQTKEIEGKSDNKIINQLPQIYLMILLHIGLLNKINKVKMNNKNPEQKKGSG